MTTSNNAPRSLVRELTDHQVYECLLMMIILRSFDALPKKYDKRLCNQFVYGVRRPGTRTLKEITARYLAVMRGT